MVDATKSFVDKRKYDVLASILDEFKEYARLLQNGELKKCEVIYRIEKAYQMLHSVIDDVALDNHPEMISSVMRRVSQTLQDNYTRVESITGVSTGYYKIDDMLHGLQRGDLIVVGARPSVGKTSWLINLANYIAIHDKESKVVAFFTLDVSKNDLGMRMLSVESRVDMNVMRSGEFSSDDWRRLATASGILAEANIFVDDSHLTSVSTLRAKCMQIKDEAKSLGVVLVDCIQLMSVGTDVIKREQQMLDIMSSLKMLAEELEVPIVITSQLDSKLENRVNKRPLLSDFREPLAVENSADVVMFIYRDGIYDGTDNNKVKAEVIIAKNKNGQVGSVELLFLEDCMRFENLQVGMHDDEQFIYDNYRSDEIADISASIYEME